MVSLYGRIFWMLCLSGVKRVKRLSDRTGAPAPHALQNKVSSPRYSTHANRNIDNFSLIESRPSLEERT